MEFNNEIATLLGLTIKDISANNDNIYIELFNGNNEVIYTNSNAKAIKKVQSKKEETKIVKKTIRIKDELYTLRITISLESNNNIDEHTDLNTKSFFNHSIYNKISKNKTSIFVMCDIDLFKQINDKYGHIEGDRVLRKVSGIIRKNIRQTDYAIRFGGDEILLVFPNSNISEIRTIIDNISNEVKNTIFEAQKITDIRKVGEDLIRRVNIPQEIMKNSCKEQYNITMSFGIYEYNPKEFIVNPLLNKKETIINRADKALYISKQNGRNKITEYNMYLHEKMEC